MKIQTPHLRHLHLPIAGWWLVSIVAVFVLTALLTLYAVLVFIRAAAADVVTGDAGAAVESISREALAETLKDFEARALRFESIKARYEGVRDPSRGM